MTTISSSLAVTGTDSPLNNPSQVARMVGVRKQLNRSSFDSAITSERLRITNNSAGIYLAGEEFQILGEVGVRKWTLATGGNDAANASNSHARNIQINNAVSITLASDTNSAWSNSGAPSNSFGLNGDISVDYATGKVYLKTSGSWGVSQDLGTTGGNAAQVPENITIPLNNPYGNFMPFDPAARIVATPGYTPLVGALVAAGICVAKYHGVNDIDLSNFKRIGPQPVAGYDYTIYYLNTSIPPNAIVVQEGTIDVTKPALGSPHIENAAKGIIAIPVTEPNSPTLIGNASGVTLSRAGATGRNVTGISFVGGELRITFSPVADYTTDLGVAIAAGMIRDAENNQSNQMNATVVTNNIPVPVPNAPTITLGNAASNHQTLTIVPGVVDSAHGAATTYKLYKKLTSDSAFTLFDNSSSLSRDVTGLTSSQNYSYYAVAENPNGSSPNGATVNQTTSAGASSGTLAAVFSELGSGGIDTNLTTDAAAYTDWLHLRNSNHKLNGIGGLTFELYNSNYFQWAGTDHTYSWSAGDNTAGTAGAGVGEGLRIQGDGSGLRPGAKGVCNADTSTHFLDIFAFRYRYAPDGDTNNLVVNATLSDGSAAAISQAITTGSDGYVSIKIRITFKAGSAGQTLSWNVSQALDQVDKLFAYEALAYK